MPRLRIAVLVSGGGTNLQAILDAIQGGRLDAEVACVISNRKAAFALERARKFGIDDHYIGKGNYPDAIDREGALLDVLKTAHVDLIVLAGYLSILPPALINCFKNRIINIHPSLLPSFSGEGFYGEHVHRAVLAAKVTHTGATVHFVDEGVDTGNIIAQKQLEVLADDSVATLSKRVLVLEHALLIETLIAITQGKITIGEEASYETKSAY